MRLFVFGLGYTARCVGRQLLAEGWQVAGTCRSPLTCAALEYEGFDVHVFDGTKPMNNVGQALSGATHVLDSVPPGDEGDAVLRHHGADIAALSPLPWFGYLSTTGVYGDHGGAWVDEDMPRTPTTTRGHRRAEAEAGWETFALTAGLPVHLFRLPGIYGPSRSQIETVRHGRTRRVYKEGQVFSRIHVADLAAAIIASMKQPSPGAVYNICDDEPAPPQDVTAYACELLNMPVEPLTPIDQADLTPMARSFYAENKRVRNDRMKRELGIVLQYPTYREGLRAILADE